MNKIIDNFVIQEKIGAGQFGEVFRGYCRLTKQLVALKVYSLQKFMSNHRLKESILNEINAVSNLNHPNIIKFLKMLKTSNNIYLIYEYCDGGNLEDYILKHSFLSEKETLLILCQLASAFKEIIKNDIIHRDVKPANILLSQNNFKIADFGLCIIFDKHKEKIEKLENIINNAILNKPSIVGSPIYMAPELLKGNQINKKSDIYSLGVMTYEMLFGVCPYEESNVESLIYKIEKSELKFPIEMNPVSSKTIQLIKKMLISDPGLRIEWEEFFNFFQLSNLNNQKQLQIEINIKKEELINDLNFVKSAKFNNKNELKSFDIIDKFLIKERNKAFYLANVIAAILDLNLNYLSALSVMILIRMQLSIYSKIIEFKDNIDKTIFDSLKFNKEILFSYLQTDHSKIFFMKINEENIKIQENYQLYNNLLNNNSYNLDSKFLSFDNKYFEDILLTYVYSVKARALILLSEEEIDLAKKILIHANNILDAMKINDFFNKFIDSDITQIEDQEYFIKILDFSINDFFNLIDEKINEFNK